MEKKKRGRSVREASSFTVIVNCSQTVESTTIRPYKQHYKQHEKLTRASKPVWNLAGLAVDARYVNADSNKADIERLLVTILDA